MTVTAMPVRQNTGPLGLLRPVPRGSTTPRRAFGGPPTRTGRTGAPVGAGWAHTAPVARCGGGDALGAAQALFAALRRAGVGGIYGAVHDAVSVVSLPRGITVWVRGGMFSWRDASGRQVVHSGDDAEGAARALVAELMPAAGLRAA